MMELKKISILSVEFNVSLTREEFPVLNEVIENNLGLSGIIKRWKETEVGNYVHPVCQYKNVEAKTCLFCYGMIPFPVRNLFTDTDWSVWIKPSKELFKVSEVKFRSAEIGVTDSYYQYNIRNWVFGSKDRGSFGHSDSLQKEADKFLRKDVLHSVETLGADTGEGVDTIVIGINQGNRNGNESDPLTFYDIEFVSNVVFPGFFSIGGGSDVGFGVISLKHTRSIVQSKRGTIMSGR